MALVLSLREGQDFYLGGERIVVGKVSGLTRFDLVVTRTGKRHAITDEEAVEIADDVFVSAGDRPQRGIARVAIAAPRSVTIIRGDRYRAEQESAT